MRGGSISPRSGWQPLCTVHPGNALYQGGWLYDNSLQGGFPYLMLSIGGEMFQVRVDTDNSVVNLSAAFGISDPATVQEAFFTQGEEFMVKQAGDGITLPLFWDGTILRRSNGLNATLGTVGNALGFNAPNIYPGPVPAFVDIDLTPGGYSGAVNQRFFINGNQDAQYMQFVPANRINLRNSYGAVAGTVLPAGSLVKSYTTGAVLATLLLDSIIPVGAPINGTYVTPNCPPQDVLINGIHLKAEAVALPALAAGHIYAVNINQTATTNNPLTSTLQAALELPAATCMDYYMGRLWYAQDRTYTAGDIVGGDSGTTGTKKRDSILKVTENPLALAGDGFAVPTNAGLIRALRHTANLDTATGTGQLYAFTRTAVYSLNVPVTRADWVNSKEPLQRVALITNGAYGDRGIVNVNGDLFFQSSDGVRSLFVAIRNFGQWGNTPISSNIDRILNFNDRSLMRFASGIQFDNRLLEAQLPYMTAVGPAFKSLAVLDFDLLSTLSEKLPPAWEGNWNGMPVLQMFQGDFGGRQRAFAVVLQEDGSIGVWEISKDDRRDNGDNRIEWKFETPAYEWGKIFELKKLDGLELWLDRIFGTVDILVEYRPDAEACWQFWNSTQLCSARTSCEDVDNPILYPCQPYGENDKFSLVFPTPPTPNCQSLNRRPMDRGYQFQCRVTVKGSCRVRGDMVFSVPEQRAPFLNMSCP